MKIKSEHLENQQQIDLKKAEQIAHDFLGNQHGLVISPLGEGSNNVNFLVGGEHQIVIKLSKPDFEYKAPADYQKENWCLARAHELGIPSPSVLQLGKHKDRAFMVESYINGSPGANLDGESSFSEEKKKDIWKKLGNYTRKINSIPVTGWGENLVGEGVFDGSWDKFLQYNIESLNSSDVLLSMGVLNQQLSDKIKGIFLSLQGKNFTFGLCHADIALRNTIIDVTGEVYLLDWGTARAEIIPYYDINEILKASKPDDETLRAFLDGYGISQEEYKQMESDLKKLNLLNEIDTLRWAIDKRPGAIQEHIDRVKDTINQIKNL